MGRCRQQSLPGRGQGLLDPQSDLGLPHHPEVEPGARRQDLRRGRRRPDRCAGWSPAAPNSYAIWKFARNQDAAIEFLRYCAEQLGRGFKASTGYNIPLFPNVVPQPMPIFSNDPSSHPADKLKVLETANDWQAVYGYPGAGGAGRRRGRQRVHHPRHDGQGGDRQDDARGGGGLGEKQIERNL